jgi:hypothetical protein
MTAPQSCISDRYRVPRTICAYVRPSNDVPSRFIWPASLLPARVFPSFFASNRVNLSSAQYTFSVLISSFYKAYVGAKLALCVQHRKPVASVSGRKKSGCMFSSALFLSCQLNELYENYMNHDCTQRGGFISASFLFLF